MAFIAFGVVLLFTCQVTAQDRDVLNGTKLVLTFLVHRHGDRTPVTNSLPLVGKNAELKKLIAKWGFGQLTNAGIRRGYEVGQFIRRRYNELLSKRFKRSEIYIRSTDVTRTKMTVLTAMAAVYPAIGDTWSQHINWVPVPYTTVPRKYDHNIPLFNCPNYISANNKISLLPTPKMDRFVKMLRNLSVINHYDYNLRSPRFASSVYDLFASELSLGLDIGDKNMKLMPELEEAAGEAFNIIFSEEKYLPLQAGVLLKEFLDVTATAIAGKATQRVRVYSAHDFNVYSFQAISRITPRQGVPKYGAVFALELRKVVATGKYVVLPVYVKSPGEPEIYLPVEGCSDLLCDIHEFRNITSKYALNENEWRIKCGLGQKN